MGLRIIAGLAFALLTTTAGLEASTTLPKAEPIRGYGFVDAFPGTNFENPVGFVAPPGETNRLFVLEQTGRIIVIPDFREPATQTFLDLRQNLIVSTEAGLLGLAFHPNFAVNGRFFVYRTVQRNGGRMQLSEFRCDPKGNYADGQSERVLISQLDMLDTHNAGDLKFGPDGYLYLALGDELPGPPDEHTTPQAIDKGFFGGIIRIDIDSRPENLAPNPHGAVIGGYRVPRDNPFVGTTEFNGLPVNPAAVRTEFYAVGLRNPWRFTFDPGTGQLICADVGAGEYEEIDLIEPGGNYGWPYVEGPAERALNIPPNLSAPIHYYSHGLRQFEGNAVIGGVVARGGKYSALEGKYVFADFESGSVWAIDPYGGNTSAEWLTGRAGISAFGKDPADGSILVANVLTGKIERLVEEGHGAGLPERLSEVGAFTDLGEFRASDSLTPFEVNIPLWSDGATKTRWIDLSGASEAIQFRATNHWLYPEGAVFVKHFELETTNNAPESRRRVETRFLVKTRNDIYGATYRWNEDQSDAFLVPPEGAEAVYLIHDSGLVRTQVWAFPSAEQCRTCHNSRAGYVLGFNTHQLNRAIATPAGPLNQLSVLAARGVFGKTNEIVPDNLFKLSSLSDPHAPLQQKVRSYLESNCVQCHQPGGRSRARWDARAEVPMENAGILNVAASFYPPPMKIIESRSLENSYIYNRASVRVPSFQMPPLATSRADEQFLDVLGQWILSTPLPEWVQRNYGTAIGEGAAEQNGNAFRVSSPGNGFLDGSYFFLGRELSGGMELTANLSSLSGDAAGKEGGLVVRAGLEAGAGVAALYLKDGRAHLALALGGEMDQVAIPDRGFRWLKLVTDGEGVAGAVSEDLLDWTPVGRGRLPLNTKFYAGFMAAGGGRGMQFGTAEFASHSVRTIQLIPPARDTFTLPASVALQAQVTPAEATNSHVAFYAGSTFIGDASGAPWRFTWTNALEGTVEIRAVLNHSVTSPPIALHLEAEAPQVWAQPLDLRTLGNWRRRYGAELAFIPGALLETNGRVSLSFGGGTDTSAVASSNPAALLSQSNRWQSVRFADGALEFSLETRDYQPRRGSLYFVDWLNLGSPQSVSFWGPDRTSPLLVTNVSAATPVYLNFAFRAPVTVRIQNPKGPAYVTAIFADPLPAISTELLDPPDGAIYHQPAWVPVTISASAPGREITRVELWDGESPIASFNEPPATIALTNLFPGTHVLRSFAKGSYGTTALSAPAAVTILPPAPSAHFLGADTNTSGWWRKRYGKDGYWVIGAPEAMPSWLEIIPRDYGEFLFTPSSALPQVLQWSEDGSFRFASSWYGTPSFSLDMQPLHGWPARVGFYLLDYNEAYRSTEILVEDRTGNVLDRRNVSEYALGKYYFWEIQGEVRFRFVAKTQNAVISAIFLDQSLTAADLLRNNLIPPELVDADPATFMLDADGDGVANGLELFLGFDPLDSGDRPVLRAEHRDSQLLISLAHRGFTAGVRLIFECSSDLQNWAEKGPSGVSVLSEGGVNYLRFSFDLEGWPAGFVRIRPDAALPE